MDGRPLYEYARNGIPLPRPIEKREVTVHSLELAEWKSSDHQFRWPDRQASEEDRKARERLLQDIEGVLSTESEQQRLEVTAEEAPTAFVLKMKVSGGTYVRSIVHDLGRMLGSAGHVVTLTRSRQGRFALDPVEESDRSCVPWEVFSKALEDVGKADEDGLLEWERSIIDNIEIVEAQQS
jgi:tRNA pseudouridine55 synthase